ncbi:hypothetical protein RhiirC2_783813 [Rhizophagus irregularis]|uniref:Uncharacterized protein n=1 Tax=Rhizophagus irregularis TaxID=588596 RepID=A0A2N1MZY0_9GLOM|nr:hypothetical protein RhiirC2_783813 [Rhizophagus irregularis]
MVRRHSFNRRARQDLKEFIRRSRRRDSKVRMTHLWCIYVAATSGVCVKGLDLVGIADVKNTRDIDDGTPPFSGFRCHYMKRYDNINNGGMCRPLNYAHRTQQQALRCHRSHFCHGILDWKDVCWSRDYGRIKMVRRHSFNRRARQDLRESIRRSRRRDKCLTIFLP